MSFEAFDQSILVNRRLKNLNLKAHNPDLYRQLRRAAASVSLNLAEGAGRRGADRKQHFRIAHGNALEVEACLLVAHAWDDLDDESILPVRPELKRLLQLLHGLCRR